jgi:hypothetical protein
VELNRRTDPRVIFELYKSRNTVESFCKEYVMGTGIDADFRNQFLARLQTTTRFWELAGLNHMFERKGFHVSIGNNQGTGKIY